MSSNLPASQTQLHEHQTNQMNELSTPTGADSVWNSAMPVKLFTAQEAQQKMDSRRTTLPLPQEIMDAFIDSIPPLNVQSCIIRTGSQVSLKITNDADVRPWLGIFYVLPLHEAAQKWVRDSVILPVNAFHTIEQDPKPEGLYFPNSFLNRIKQFGITEMTLLVFKTDLPDSVPSVSLSGSDTLDYDGKTARHLCRIVSTFVRGEKGRLAALSPSKDHTTYPYQQCTQSPPLSYPETNHEYFLNSSSTNLFHFQGSTAEAYNGCYIPATSSVPNEIRRAVINSFTQSLSCVVLDITSVQALEHDLRAYEISQVFRRVVARRESCGGTIVDILRGYGRQARVAWVSTMPGVGVVRRVLLGKDVVDALVDGTLGWQKDAFVHFEASAD